LISERKNKKIDIGNYIYGYFIWVIVVDLKNPRLVSVGSGRRNALVDCNVRGGKCGRGRVNQRIS